MGEELKELIRKRIQMTEARLKDLEIGSRERDAAVKEITELTQLLNADLRNRVEAWDLEEKRRIDEFDKNERRRIDETDREEGRDIDRKRGFWEVVKTVIQVVGTGISGLVGVREIYKWVWKMEKEGVIGNRDILKHLPKIKFW